VIKKIVSLPFALVFNILKLIFGIIRLALRIVFGLVGFVLQRVLGTVFGGILGFVAGTKRIGLRSGDKEKKK